ncbi:antirepressor protein [Lactobacillus phage Maenad]|uniref:Antirepressor protein n=1 Tax=Lactobacillus phage Maenad TaxID=2079431 RepID=A0A2P0ZL44_9CAUD|nr:anti-repressor [Lactobacillus phage Maenad]AVH85681.1 antirepressor protein [Lactobacillus phage Maenad]
MENELVIMHDRQAVTSSLQVAETFEKQHKNIIRDIDKLLESGGSTLSREMFAKGAYANRGKQYPMYYMNRDGFTLLAMGFTGKKAMQFKLKYIEAFNSMEKQLSVKTDSYMIQDPIKRAERWIEEQRELKEVQKKLEIAKPKAQFADAVSTSKTSISITTLAKLLKQNGADIGRNRLFAWLRNNNYLIKSGDDRNTPTQRSMELGLFEVREKTYFNDYSDTAISKSSRVTGKGQQYFINKFLKEQY